MLAQIEQEIAELETATTEVEGKIEVAFRQYVIAIAQAIQSQLVTSAYKLCTQSYPEQFLQLSQVDRQQLQQDLQTIASDANSAIQAQLNQMGQELQPTHEMVEKLLTESLETLSKLANQALITAQFFDQAQLAEDTPQISLQLNEIELSDREVISHRSELRLLSNRWHQCQEELERKKQAKLVAQADLAWRSSWTEIS
jgi:ElaB/YqjD/DUF883 family membrane-anchored ribosome-binding protein